MSKPEWIEKMRAVAKDIILFNPKGADMTRKQAMSKFYKIMQKHGIKQGEWTEDGGRICNNFEWTMCLTLFNHTIQTNNMLQDIVGENMPKSLEAYGIVPKIGKTKK